MLLVQSLSGLSWTAGPGAVDAMLAAARRFPARLAYGGSSCLAFLSGRRMPGEQPDLFILATARVDVRSVLVRPAINRAVPRAESALSAHADVRAPATATARLRDPRGAEQPLNRGARI